MIETQFIFNSHIYKSQGFYNDGNMESYDEWKAQNKGL